MPVTLRAPAHAAHAPRSTSRHPPALRQASTAALRRPARSRPFPARRPAASVHAAADYVPQVKICGITTPEDASIAAQAGADYIGMILWPHSKRSIPVEVAREVVVAAREAGAEPVGVFVSESAQQILDWCSEIGLQYVQLHGEESRDALSGIPSSTRVFYTMTADKDGAIITSRPGEKELDATGSIVDGEKGWRKASDWVSRGRRVVDYLLIDGMQPGSGETFDWNNLKVPRGASRKGWILAGGLNLDNVEEAVSILRPDMVDVASGVCTPDGIRKDPTKVKKFIEVAKGISS